MPGVTRIYRWVLESVAVAAAVGLWVHARSYDFFADDAFITLRYGQYLWEHGAPIYNLGQRVEGYTSPLWLLFAAVAHCSEHPVEVMQGLGGLAGALWLFGLARMWKCLWPKSPAGGMLVLVATALLCPVAAWTMGGLETPLFGALLTWSITLAAPLTKEKKGYRRALAVGFLLALTTFARPEGALVAAAVGGSILLLRLRKVQWRAPVLMMGTYAAFVGAHVVWRILYYGYCDEP